MIRRDLRVVIAGTMAIDSPDKAGMLFAVDCLHERGKPTGLATSFLHTR